MLVQVARVAVDFGMLILIWLVQLIIYPSFQYSARESFIQWHEKYTGLITLVVLPSVADDRQRHRNGAMVGTDQLVADDWVDCRFRVVDQAVLRNV